MANSLLLALCLVMWSLSTVAWVNTAAPWCIQFQGKCVNITHTVFKKLNWQVFSKCPVQIKRRKHQTSNKCWQGWVEMLCIWFLNYHFEHGDYHEFHIKVSGTYKCYLNQHIKACRANYCCHMSYSVFKYYLISDQTIKREIGTRDRKCL